VTALMTITKQSVADQIAAYLHHEISLAHLVDWSERALLDGELAERDAETLSSVIARLGVADMRAFGLTWEDCEELLRKLGFAPRIEVVAA
jgi:cobyrinic acid a,c-diamide synthase